MENRAENSLREQLLHSNGKILGGFSHELKNHVAVINESVGLLQDFIDMGRITEKELCSKITRIITQLEKRTTTIATMAHHLNSFSHRFDTPSSSFDCNHLVREQIFLLQRFTKLKRVILGVKIADTSLYIHNNPSLIQYILQKLFEEALKLSQEEDELQFYTGLKNEKVRLGILLRSKSPHPTLSGQILQKPEMLLCLEKTGAQFALAEKNRHEYEMEIILPKKWD